jgi:flagellar basal body-associated protein FliL
MKKMWFILGIILIIILVIIAFIYFALAKPSYKKEDFNVERQNVTRVEATHVKYLLNEMGAWQLHNIPLSYEKPGIEVVVDDQTFYAEVDKGVIEVSKESLDNVDLKISVGAEELIKVLASDDIKTSIKDSVSAGRIQLELVAGYTKLFSKGYLGLYKDVTGKSFTGSVVRIFAQ